MAEHTKENPESGRKRNADFIPQIERAELRKLKARSQKGRSVWLGLGVMGVIGWSVVLPTLLGAALGIWLDRNVPQRFSWTLTLLLGGLLLGCLLAYNWVKEENQSINKDKNE